VILEDLREIHRLATEKVTLGTVNHAGSSVTVNGAAPDVDDIFSYARDLRNLRDSANDLRFSGVWISSITRSGGGFNFVFSLTK